MAHSLSDTAALHQLQAAFVSGTVHLVNEKAHPVTFEEALDARCWAHLRDAADGKVYVHELPGSRDLLEARYQQLLGLNV